MNTQPQFIETADGSHTLFIESLQETYHSRQGAIQESTHVFINHGLLACKKKTLTLFEVGFGTGLNCLLSLMEAEKRKLHLSYHTVEKHPLQPNIFKHLNYAEKLDHNVSILFQRMHDIPWNKSEPLTPFFILEKRHESLMEYDFSPNFFDIVFFDAFGPDKQPEMWTEKNFQRIHDSMKTGGILTTYSAKGAVRRSLLNAGFQVEKLPGPPGKREMLRATKL